jgi:hypothetical protein
MQRRPRYLGIMVVRPRYCGILVVRPRYYGCIVRCEDEARGTKGRQGAPRGCT